ncbi:MAG: LacI family DNA-binding transcriptional regulator [Gammaproteobacteria bacterium]
MMTLPPHPVDIAELKAEIRQQARRVTSYDVARAAGVSQSAVSRAFQPGASVSKATHARVMQAARELDYVPNAAARSLNTRRSNLVAVLMPVQVTLHYPEVLSQLSRQFSQRGLRMLLLSLARENDIDDALAQVWQHQVDGAVVAARLSSAQIAEFERRRLPLVLFNRGLPDNQASAVVCDQRGAARLLVGRLAAAGHKRFALIDGPPESPVALERRRGVAERLAELGLGAPLCVNGSFDYSSGGRGLREIVVRLGHVPDAVICGNDVMAIGCLDTARHEMKLDVPGQLSITGFGGIAQGDWLSYKLTTLRQPMHEMTQAAATALLDLIEGAGPTRTSFSAVVVDGATARLGPAF